MRCSRGAERDAFAERERYAYAAMLFQRFSVLFERAAWRVRLSSACELRCWLGGASERLQRAVQGVLEVCAYGYAYSDS